MSFDPTNSMAAVQAAIRCLTKADSENYRCLFAQVVTSETSADIIRDCQNAMVSIAGLQQSTRERLAYNWTSAGSLLSAGEVNALQSGFSSQEVVEQALRSLQAPRFETVQTLLLADFAHGSASLRTLAEVFVEVGASSLLERQGQRLAESYTSFSNDLGSSAISEALGAAGLSAATANLERSITLLASLAQFDLSAEPFPFTSIRPNWFDVFRQDLEAKPEQARG